MLETISHGIKKWKRNWAAREGKTDFEKVKYSLIFSI